MTARPSRSETRFSNCALTTIGTSHQANSQVSMTAPMLQASTREARRARLEANMDDKGRDLWCVRIRHSTRNRATDLVNKSKKESPVADESSTGLDGRHKGRMPSICVPELNVGSAEGKVLPSGYAS
ncbi:hypothetical protein [Acidovorax sp. WCS2018Noco2-16]|uniref:hypothetical protein n=1 Tax=Acidovorax sp. WCS2018Noco2-16 TaxID=3073624 RepID=UPI00288342D0|nr:hypothetical protein [Acidovorax sp. WCS2018Noco2-16]